MIVQRLCLIVRWASLIAPIVLLLAAVGAGSLGPNPDQSWGPIRLGALCLGAAGTLVAILSQSINWPERKDAGWTSSSPPLDRRQRPLAKPNGTSRSDEPKRKLDTISPPGRNYSLRSLKWLVPVLILVQALYIFIISAGHWYPWPQSTSYYDMLAKGFVDGSLSLPVAPDPRLADLQDPYSPANRVDVPVITDASYFDGKYFLYWGPVPAILVAVLKLTIGWSIADHHILFAAVNLLLAFSLLIVFRLRQLAPFEMPTWLVMWGIFGVATAHPILWTLAWPTIYPAAIVSGQAFLLGGIYVMLPPLQTRTFGTWRPLLAGTLLALALGSRLTLAIPVTAFVVVTVLASWRNLFDRSTVWSALKPAVLLAAPLGLTLGLLAWYNYSRFGNPLETGFQYALGGFESGALPESATRFSIGYAIPNAAHYLGTPLRFRQSFPFVRPFFEEVSAIRALARQLGLPNAYHVENVAGLLFAAPILVLPFFHLMGRICSPGRFKSMPGRAHALAEKSPGFLGYERLILLLLLVSVCAALPILSYFWITNRFLLDFVPLLAIASTASGWAIYASRSRYRPYRILISIILLALLVTGSLVSVLLAMTGTAARFDDVNPLLWIKLTEVFSW